MLINIEAQLLLAAEAHHTALFCSKAGITGKKAAYQADLQYLQKPA